MKQNLDLNAPVKSSESSGSGEQDKIKDIELNEYKLATPEEIEANRRKVIELSNESILHGYDMAIELVELSGSAEAASLLKENREIIAKGLGLGIEDRIKDNVTD